MKKLLFSILTIFTLCSPAYAVDPAFLAVVSAGGAAASGTWYYNLAADKRGDTLTTNSNSFYLGGKVTPGAGTASKIAFYVQSKETATAAKVWLATPINALQDNAPILSGTCAPANTTWCVVDISQAVTAQEYHIFFRTDATVKEFGDADGGVGMYGNDGSYASNPPVGTFAVSQNYASSFAVAICVGTCTTGP